MNDDDHNLIVSLRASVDYAKAEIASLRSKLTEAERQAAIDRDLALVRQRALAEAVARYERAETSSPPVAQQGWRRDVENAPLNTAVLIAWEDELGVSEAYRNPETGRWWFANQDEGDYDASAIDREPTHWMPLPPAPSSMIPGNKETP